MIALAALASFVAAAPGVTGCTPSDITAPELFKRTDHALESLFKGAYHVVARTLSNQGAVTLAEMAWNGNDYKTTVRQAEFTSSFGENRGTKWRQDANGIVMRSLSFVGQDDPFSFALNRNQDTIVAVKLLGLTNGSAPEYVVEVTPLRDFEQWRYYDAKTYLLSRVEMTDYRGRKTTWIYKTNPTAIGSSFPTTIDEEKDGVVTLRTSVVTFERVAPGALDLRIPPSNFLFDLGGREAVDIPAHFTDEGIIVPIAIEGRGLDVYLEIGRASCRERV